MGRLHEMVADDVPMMPAGVAEQPQERKALMAESSHEYYDLLVRGQTPASFTAGEVICNQGDPLRTRTPCWWRSRPGTSGRSSAKRPISPSS